MHVLARPGLGFTCRVSTLATSNHIRVEQALSRGTGARVPKSVLS